MTAPDALEQLLAANTADLHGYLLRRVGDPHDAADALHDVLLTAVRRREQVPSDPHEGRLWLFGVAANVDRNQRRARWRRTALARTLMADPTRQGDDAEDPAGAAVRDAVDALPSELAELVRLHHWEGFGLAEAATILGIPASTARTRYGAARRRLRAALADRLGPPPEPDRPQGPPATISA
ncbi:RNA polymerase sigma factor [uncultured Nocardioides sp.]|uniref:RNA polymerase sigma factor n=1 Tax=uncultured Nocardioides sp. TaxID=198441 RepID=UPI00261A4573|nr:RNA polymerase sigma factor [uncultured Nocardioides sp.]